MIKEAWKTFAGIEEVPAIIGSVIIYFLIFLTCLSLQRLSKKLLPKNLYVFAADFFITLAICAYPYGHGTTRQLYGHIGYLVAAVPLVMLTLQSFDGCASPLGVFIKFLKDEETAGKFVLRVIVQTIAAFLSLKLVLLVCLMETTPHHKQLLHRTICATDLKVSVTTGFVIEFAGVLFDVWLSAHRLFKNSFLDHGIKVLNSCLLVCGGVHLTGMYMHPAMASGMSWACEGTSTLEHLFVYWCAPFLGCYVGLVLKSGQILGIQSKFDKSLKKKE